MSYIYVCVYHDTQSSCVCVSRHTVILPVFHDTQSSCLCVSRHTVILPVCFTTHSHPTCVFHDTQSSYLCVSRHTVILPVCFMTHSHPARVFHIACVAAIMQTTDIESLFIKMTVRSDSFRVAFARAHACKILMHGLLLHRHTPTVTFFAYTHLLYSILLYTSWIHKNFAVKFD